MSSMSEKSSVAPKESPSEKKKHHPAPPHFNPLPPLHATPSHVHSVVPDLMKVYDSLTNNPSAHETGAQRSKRAASSRTLQDHQRQDTTRYAEHHHQQVPNQAEAQLESQHVNYSFITSEEQYRELYQQQSPGSPSLPDGNYTEQKPSSLPYIPGPYNFDNESKNSQSDAGARNSDEGAFLGKTSGGEDLPLRPSSRSSIRRKRNRNPQVQLDDPAGSATSRPKGRKKAKETDGRWSKRFTWPEELHRDFVSAVFDVGLKHSSPSTVLEHMPKHPQITSERIKSHLQKYRVHRAKSKEQFMSSYESTLKKFQAGKMDDVTALSDAEVGAHLTHTVMTNATNPRRSSVTLAREGTDSAMQKPAGKQHSAALPFATTHGSAALQPDQEALMLPKLTESEKTSPIGAAMGYLLGLFFALKKQLLVQRSSLQLSGVEGAAPGSVGSVALTPSELSGAITSGPVAAVYESFAGIPPNGPGSSNQGGKQLTTPLAAQSVNAAQQIDWSSAHATPMPSVTATNDPAGRGQSGQCVAPAPSGEPIPVLKAASTRNNLETSSIMKREMESQMAFQNKMRALKQQELNKYKDVPLSHNNSDNIVGREGSWQQDTEANRRTAKPKPPEGLPYAGNSGGQQHQHVTTSDEVQQAQSSVVVVDSSPGHGGHEESVDHNSGNKPEGAVNVHDTSGQGAGEAAAAVRARAPSFSMGGNDDFWNADVMDEQLFEFLMNN